MNGVAAASGRSRVREIPTLSVVLREELMMVGRRWTQGRPWVVGAGWLLLIAYFVGASRMGPLLPFLVGYAVGAAPWNNRLLGRSVEWELPVRRTTLNRVRAAAGMVGVVAIMTLLMPFAVYFTDSAWSGQPLTFLLSGAGAGMLGFTGGFLLGLVSRGRQPGTYMAALVFLFLIGLLPSRFILWFLPEAFHGAIIGPYGLHTVTGRSLIEVIPSGTPPTAFYLENWIVGALIWGTVCFGVLFVVSRLHHE